MMSNLFIAGALSAKFFFLKRARAVLNPKKFILSRERAVRTNKYASTQAQLRFGNDLSVGEKDFLERRTKKVHATIEKMLNLSIDDKNTSYSDSVRWWWMQRRMVAILIMVFQLIMPLSKA